MLQQPKPSPPVITVYKNGDMHFLGKKIVVNQKQIRTFECFLDKVTKATGSEVAIRKVHSANSGNRLVNLGDIKNGGNYVASGIEKFVPLHYQKIHEERHVSKPMPMDVTPVSHSRVVVASRCRKEAMAEPLKNRIIFIYSNGKEKDPPMKLLLDKRVLQTMDTVLQYISYKINLQSGAVRSIHAVDGIKLHDVKEIITNTPYVAVGSEKHFFKRNYSRDQRNSLIRKSTISPKYKVIGSLSKEIRPKEKKQMKSGNSSSTMTVSSSVTTFSGKNSAESDYSDSTERLVSTQLNGKTKNNVSKNTMNISQDETTRNWIKSVETANSSNSYEIEEKANLYTKIPNGHRENMKERNDLNDEMYMENENQQQRQQPKEFKKEAKEKQNPKNVRQEPKSPPMSLYELNHESDEEMPVYKATGNQMEQAETVHENNETRVEKTIDMMQAVEVAEEIEVDENESEAFKQQQKRVPKYTNKNVEMLQENGRTGKQQKRSETYDLESPKKKMGKQTVRPTNEPENDYEEEEE